MIYPLFISPVVTLIVIVYYSVTSKLFFRSIFFSSLAQGIGFTKIANLLTLLSLNINLLYGIYLWKAYPIFINNTALFPANSWFELQHTLNLPFIILSTAILLIAVLTAWYSSIDQFTFAVLILVTEVFLVGAFSCTSLFLFLLFFEASALPIFILIVYCGSPRRERIKASYYFLFFTLYGSISLLLVIINSYAVLQTSKQGFEFLNWLLLFVAFAVKIPLFPFHILLPYAHVEASTATSIILAALMLKLGGYGLIKFMLPFFSLNTHMFFRPFAMFISISGVVYGSLCALRQLDLKRQIAFSSISHMSFASLGIFSFSEIGIKGAVYLMLSHGLTAPALFFAVGILSDRYHTRSIMAFSGLFGSMPLFSCFFLFLSLANIGFPGTSGFLPELFILIGVLTSFAKLLAPALFSMLLVTTSTMLPLLKLLFGHTKFTYVTSTFTDITKLEFFILSNLSVWILVLGLKDIL